MATVLIVDDDPKLLTMLRRTLVYEGFRVFSATNGTEALGEVQAHRPDVVVLDWLMPGLDGIGVLEHLRAGRLYRVFRSQPFPGENGIMKIKRMVQIILPALLAGATFASAWAAPVPKAHAVEVTMGSVAMDIPVEMIRRMSALASHLALNTSLNIRFRPSPNLGSAVEDLGTGQTQIAYLTPVAYVEARKKYGVIPLVAPTTDGRPHFALVIGVKAGSGINSPEGLKGKRFAFGDEKALLQRAAVESMGLKSADFA